MKTLVYVSVLLTLILATVADANTLYQWTGKDGTPTYSPDPPPKGIPFTVVGPDLQPLKGQTVQPSAQTAITPAITTKGPATSAAVAGTNTQPDPAAAQPRMAGSIVLTPPPSDALANQNPTVQQKPVTKWKPVKYADDPNPDASRPVFTKKAIEPESVAPSIPSTSDHCLSIKQKHLLLESQFSNAPTAADMDSAILKLNAFRQENKGQCGL